MAFSTVLGAVIMGGSTAAGAAISSHEAGNAADVNAQAQEQIAAENAAAQKYAADLQAKAAADSLAFSKASAENAYQNNEASRQGNYNTWAAEQNRMGAISKLLGFGDRAIPSYVPGVDPNFNGTGTGSSGSGSGTSGTPDYSALITALNNGGSPQSVIDQFNQSQGLPNGASYAWRSIPNAAGGGVVEIPGGSYLSPTGPNGSWVWSAGDSGNSGASSPQSTTPSGPTFSVASYLGTTPQIAPSLSMPNPYAVSSYLS